MDYISLNTLPHYSDCEPLVSGLGYLLVDLKVVPRKGVVSISAVIASKDPSKDIGVEDCSKIHHALMPRLEAILGTEDTEMEVTSPGMDRNIKNAAEFALFKGREVRVWDRNINDWTGGVIEVADEESVTLKSGEKSETVKFADIAKAKFIYM